MDAHLILAMDYKIQIQEFIVAYINRLQILNYNYNTTCLIICKPYCFFRQNIWGNYKLQNKSSMKVYLFSPFNMCNIEFPAGDFVGQQIMKETAMLNLSIGI